MRRSSSEHISHSPQSIIHGGQLLPDKGIKSFLKWQSLLPLARLSTYLMTRPSSPFCSTLNLDGQPAVTL